MHRGTAALMAGRRGESVHGGGNYWRIMRAAATAAKWNNRERTLCHGHNCEKLAKKPSGPHPDLFN